jgi:hypothetical protein
MVATLGGLHDRDGNVLRQRERRPGLPDPIDEPGALLHPVQCFGELVPGGKLTRAQTTCATDPLGDRGGFVVAYRHRFLLIARGAVQRSTALSDLFIFMANAGGKSRILRENVSLR